MWVARKNRIDMNSETKELRKKDKLYKMQKVKVSMR